jgi:hypothetical protein
MFASSLREFPENSAYNHCGLNCFIEYLHRNVYTSNFLSYAIESVNKVHLLDLHIKTIHFLFNSYVFNSSQKWLNILVQISYFFRVIYHIIPFISPRSYLITCAYRFSGWYHDIGLIKGMLWTVSCNNLYLYRNASIQQAYFTIHKYRSHILLWQQRR